MATGDVLTMIDERTPYTLKQFLIGMVLILIGIVTCISLVAYSGDYACIEGAKNWIPIYPDGREIRAEENVWFRRFGMGTTLLVLQTDDPPNTVRGWYFDQNTEASLNRKARPGELNWRVDPLDNGGSEITLSSTCGWNN